LIDSTGEFSHSRTHTYTHSLNHHHPLSSPTKQDCPPPKEITRHTHPLSVDRSNNLSSTLALYYMQPPSHPARRPRKRQPWPGGLATTPPPAPCHIVRSSFPPRAPPIRIHPRVVRSRVPRPATAERHPDAFRLLPVVLAFGRSPRMVPTKTRHCRDRRPHAPMQHTRHTPPRASHTTPVT